MSIKFVSRKEVFIKNLTLARQLLDIQKVEYNPNAGLVAAGDEVYLEIDDDAPTVLTPVLAGKWNKEQVEYCNSMRDKFDDEPPAIEFFGQIIAELPLGNIEGFFDIIGNKISLLCELIGWKEVLVISESVSPYLSQTNDYPPVKMATQKLQEMGLSKDFLEGMILKNPTSEMFFKNIFWIIRCNASAPNVLFSGVNSSIVGTLCKYGNIHFECYNLNQKTELLEALERAGFIVVEDGVCEEKFSSTSAIQGRMLEI